MAHVVFCFFFLLLHIASVIALLMLNWKNDKLIVMLAAPWVQRIRLLQGTKDSSPPQVVYDGLVIQQSYVSCKNRLQQIALKVGYTLPIP